jgi:hypothetical protein
MINTHFHKVASVTLASVVAFSSSTFASTSNIKAINHAIRLGNSDTKILVAQQRCPLKDNPAFSKSLAFVETSLQNAYAAANSAAIAGKEKSALAKSIADAKSFLRNAIATCDSTALSDIKAIALSLTKAEAALDNALAIAKSDAISGPGKPAIVNLLASVKIAVSNGISNIPRPKL